MFRLLKTFVRKLVAETPAESQEASANSAAPSPFTPAHNSAAAPGAKSNPLGKFGQAGPQNGKGVHLQLQAILATLPLEVQPKVRFPEVGDRTVAVPLEKVLAQLSRGLVTITFGELRQAAPDVFAPENDRDKTLVPLPLSEIISRLNPALIARRRVQRTVEVPEHISSPFDAQGEGLVFSVAPSKPESAPAPVRQTQPAQPAAPAIPARSSIRSTPTPPPPAAIPMPAPAMTSAPRATGELTAAKPAVAPPPAPAAAPASAPAKLAGNTDRLTMAGAPAPNAAPKPAAVEASPLMVALTSLAEGWPDAVRKEIVEANLVDAKVALPHDSVKLALKQGKIAFSWKTVRSWISASSVPLVSAQDDTVLELPLKVVAPLFLSRQQETQKTSQKVAVDVEIPNLFFGFPQPGDGSSAEVGGVAVAAPPRPSDTNYYVWSDTCDTAHVDASEVKRNQTPGPGTRFVAKYATPNEVVSRAAALDGVAGALIALPDGLMVANQLPADFNADTIAAFLPQIFGKVSSCTKELRMGDLNNLNFTVGNIPWKIFRVNAIFFAAFGRGGQALPTAELAALAGELDHKPK